VVSEITDDDMLKMMAAENAEEFGTNFMLGTMNAVSAVLKAYAAGVVKLETPERDRYFAGPQNTFPFTAETVAEYLGWTLEDGRASPRVHTAINALELIKLEVCKAGAFQGLGHDQARAVVQQAQLVYKARLRELDKKAEEKEVKAAQKAAAKDAAKSISKAVGAIRDGAGAREVREETSKIRASSAPVATQKKEDPRGTDISRMLDRAAQEWGELGEKAKALSEKHQNLVKLFAAGAICDKALEKGLAGNLTFLEREVGRFAQAFAKARERRG